MEINYIMIGMNLLLMIVLGLEYYKQTRKNYYALILNKNGEKVINKKINPSYTDFEVDYKDKKYSYLIPEDSPFIKFKRDRLLFYEFNKPEPLNPVINHEARMFSDVFNELLQMRKIKALNEAKKSLLDGINKKYLFIGIVIVIVIILVIRGT